MNLRPIVITLAVFFAITALLNFIPPLRPHAVSLAISLTLMGIVFTLWWSFRRYIFFSLGALLLAMLTLQVPLALLINPWNVPWLTPLGGVVFVLWVTGLYIYAVDRGLNRYVREKSLMRLKAEETKGIGKL